MQEFIVDPRLSTPEELAEGMRQAQTLFKLNHTMPYTDEYNALAKELFGCEVFAYPMASIEWRKDGLDIQLPGDDPHISVQVGAGS